MFLKLLFLLLLLFTTSVVAQDIEYGKPRDLKGLTRIYVDTRGDIANRDRIIEVFEKEKSGLVVVDTFDEAQILMRFSGDSVEKITGATTRPADDLIPTAITTTNERTYAVGKGTIAIWSKTAAARLRIIMNFESTQDRIGEKNPASKFAKEFVKAFKEANGLLK